MRLFQVNEATDSMAGLWMLSTGYSGQVLEL